jgi:SAM-dependent methyltransferase
LQWARAGLECYGVDLTDAAIEVTTQRFAAEGLTSVLQRVDAETLPFPDGHFDMVYSWGVIHHSDEPQRIVAEIRRVLKPDGEFIGMFYGRYSPTVLRLWLVNALARARPWRTLSDVVWHHMENSVRRRVAPHGEYRNEGIYRPRTQEAVPGLPPRRVRAGGYCVRQALVARLSKPVFPQSLGVVCHGKGSKVRVG